jgi:hypothetical protein
MTSSGFSTKKLKHVLLSNAMVSFPFLLQKQVQTIHLSAFSKNINMVMSAMIMWIFHRRSWNTEKIKQCISIILDLSLKVNSLSNLTNIGKTRMTYTLFIKPGVSYRQYISIKTSTWMTYMCIYKDRYAFSTVLT